MLSRIRSACIALTGNRCLSTVAKTNTSKKPLIYVIHDIFPMIRVDKYENFDYIRSHIDEQVRDYPLYLHPNDRTLHYVERFVQKKCLRPIIQASNLLGLKGADEIVANARSLIAYSKYLRKIGTDKFNSKLNKNDFHEDFFGTLRDHDIHKHRYDIQQVYFDEKQVELFRKLYLKEIWLPSVNICYLSRKIMSGVESGFKYPERR